MSRFSEYLNDTQAEMKHVTWPSRSQAIWFTVFVIILSLGVAIYLGLLDAAFTYLLGLFII